MTIPDWWGFALLGLASFRIWRLLAVDTITDPLRKKLFRWTLYEEGKDGYRYSLDEFVSCPWCFGWWICVVWFGAFQVWEHGVLVASSLLALSTVVGFLAKWDQ